ncbi:MAG: hypothetical protein LBJ01_02790 [Tannerella sp.]|jgi:hypothetical protein|nr:hypothetical protein [Tannerella sp.]
MKRTNGYLMLVLLAGASLGVSAQEKLKQDGEIQVMAYGGPAATPEGFLEMKEAGFDMRIPLKLIRATRPVYTWENKFIK